MNGYQPMVKTHGDFIGGEGLIFDPVADVIERLPEVRLYRNAGDMADEARRRRDR